VFSLTRVLGICVVSLGGFHLNPVKTTGLKGIARLGVAPFADDNCFKDRLAAYRLIGPFSGLSGPGPFSGLSACRGLVSLSGLSVYRGFRSV
jgi:hypothetical protein